MSTTRTFSVFDGPSWGHVSYISDFFERFLHDRQWLPRRMLLATGLLDLCRRYLDSRSERGRIISRARGSSSGNAEVRSMLRKVASSADGKEARKTLDEISIALRRGRQEALPLEYVNVSRALRRGGNLQEAKEYLRHALEMPLPKDERATDRLLRTTSAERGAISLAKRLIHIDDYLKSIIGYRAARTEGARKIAVVSAIVGGYDAPLLPAYVENEMDYIIFSDQKVPDFGIFDVRPLPYVDIDKTRSARYVKTHLTRILGGYDVIIWLDGCIMPVAPLLPAIQDFVSSGCEFAAMLHPFRASPYEEMRMCIAIGKDDVPIIQRQREHYRSQGYKSHCLIESNVFFVDARSEKVTEMLDLWWEQIRRFSRRDQLSLNYCLDKTGVKWKEMAPRGISARNHPNLVIFEHGQVPEGYDQFAAEVNRRLSSDMPSSP